MDHRLGNMGRFELCRAYQLPDILTPKRLGSDSRLEGIQCGGDLPGDQTNARMLNSVAYEYPAEQLVTGY